MCGCISTELSRECVANVTAHVTYLWNYPYCGPESENVYDIACYICQPTWECNNYAECTMEGSQQCLSAYDIHSCNETYTGDYSEFTKSCDYCSIHGPTLTVQDEITVYEEELVKLDLETDDPDGDQINYTISEPVGDDKEWQTQKGDKGTYNVDIVVTDGFCTTTKTIKIIVKEKPYQSMMVERTAYNEFVRVGEEQQLYVTLENIGNTDIKGLKVSVFIDDLGIWRSTKKFTLYNGEEKNKEHRVYNTLLCFARQILYEDCCEQ